MSEAGTDRKRRRPPRDAGGARAAGGAPGSRQEAIRAVLGGAVSRALSCDSVRARALELGVSGWVRADQDAVLRVHAEGDAEPVAEFASYLRNGVSAAGDDGIAIEPARVEGHEQFAVRGVSAGVFVVQEHQATAHHFDLRLEVDGMMRSWAVPKGPSLDPAIKRFAVQVEDHAMAHNGFEGTTGSGGVIIWDQGSYEQGGRVAWPQALERGHAVFVLHGEKLQGGFALQRTRPGAKAQWLLIKRRDPDARPGSDIAAESPRSVVSGRTLTELLG